MALRRSAACQEANGVPAPSCVTDIIGGMKLSDIREHAYWTGYFAGIREIQERLIMMAAMEGADIERICEEMELTRDQIREIVNGSSSQL